MTDEIATLAERCKSLAALIEVRGAMAIEMSRQWRQRTSHAEGGRSSGSSDPTALSAMAALDPRLDIDTSAALANVRLRTHIARAVDELDHVRVLVEDITQHRNDDGTTRKPKPDRRVSVGECDACGDDKVSGIGEDRLRAGLCPRCHVSWIDVRDRARTHGQAIDKAQWMAARRLRVRRMLDADPTQMT